MAEEFKITPEKNAVNLIPIGLEDIPVYASDVSAGLAIDGTPAANTPATTPADPNIIPSGGGSIIRGFLKSQNYNKGVSGWGINGYGDVEFNAGIFRGALVANSLDIPDTTTANSFHVDTSGNAWWGATAIGSAVAKILNTGVLYATGAIIDGTSILGGRAASTLASAIDASGHFADDAINTATDTILGSFTFGESGALQIGTYENGVTGDLKISPTGILGRDKTGATTFSINGETGVAVLNGLVVGTNVGIGTAEDSAGVTTIIGDTVTTAYVNALAITAMGTVTAGAFVCSATGYVRGGQTAYNTGAGFFLGYDATAYKFSVGNPAGEYMRWTGSILEISSGDLQIVPAAGGSLIASADKSYKHENTEYTEVKEVKILRAGTYTVKFDMLERSSGGTPDTYGRIYKNDAPFGTEQHNTTYDVDSGYGTFSEDLTFAYGDLVQLMSYEPGAMTEVETANFRFYVKEVMGVDVISELNN